VIALDTSGIGWDKRLVEWKDFFRAGCPDHGEEVEPNEKSGYHLKFDAGVDGTYPHLIPQPETFLD
jgi:hypothetical protein